MASQASSFLFWSILLSTLVYALIHVIVKLVILTFYRKEPKEMIELKDELSQLRIDLLSVNMVDEFAKYAKLQRRIRKLTDELAASSLIRNSKMVRVKVSVSVVLHILCGIYGFYLLWFYRYVPVLTVPAEWLYPLNKMISFPMDTSGCVGITIWLAICSTVAKTLVSSAFKFAN